MNKPSFIAWRPTTTIILVAGLAALLIYSVVLYIITNFQPTVELRIGSGVYSVLVADTEAERVQGLSGVESLPPNGGLLMKFEEDGRPGIWMKDMHLPLDIIWLDKDKKVVYIVKNATPKTATDVVYAPKHDARYVLELNAGSVTSAAIKMGTVAEFDEYSSGGWW